jgi:hypothetical protein
MRDPNKKEGRKERRPSGPEILFREKEDQQRSAKTCRLVVVVVFLIGVVLVDGVVEEQVRAFEGRVLHQFVEQTVVNWSHNDRRVRFRIPVQVAYGTDVRKAEQLLLDVAGADPDVLDNPPPAVRFLAFGESGLALELRAWSSSLIHRKGVLISNLNFAIYATFTEHGVEVPYPQRVVHLRQAPPA